MLQGLMDQISDGFCFVSREGVAEEDEFELVGTDRSGQLSLREGYPAVIDLLCGRF